jgi:hypothetical protein
LRKEEIKLKICILCQPGELISSFIPELLEKFEGETIEKNFSCLGVKPTILKLTINSIRIKFLIFQSVSRNLANKLRPYYKGSVGAFIVFSHSNQESFNAAKRFYQYFRSITHNPRIPVAFIEIQEEKDTILIKEGERINKRSNEVYYEIRMGDNRNFITVFETVIMEIVRWVDEQYLALTPLKLKHYRYY